MGQGPSQHCLQDLLDQQCLDKRSSVLVKEGRANNRTTRREVQHETISPTTLNPAMLSGRHTRATLPFGRVTDKLLQKTRLPESSSKDWQSSAVRSKGPLSEITANESNMAAGQEEKNLAERQRQGQEHWMVKGVVAQNIQKWAERDQFFRTSSVESEDGGQGGGDKHISRCRKLHPCRYAKVSSQTSGTSLQSRPSFAGVVAKDINAQSGNEMGKNIAAKDFKGHNYQSPVESTELRPAALFRSPPPRRVGSGAQLSSEAMGYETARSCQEEWQGRVSAVAGAAPNGSLSERGGSSAPRILEVKMLSARGQSGNRPLDTLVF